MVEGDSGWVLQGVPSRASFRRQPRQKTFTVMSLHISDIYAKKRGIGKKLILTIRAVMLDEKVDLVAGDFNGAAWRRDDSNNIGIIEEAFAVCALPMPPGPHEALGIRPTDQSCRHEAWLHLDFVEWRSEQSHRERHDRRVLLKERSAPYHYG